MPFPPGTHVKTPSGNPGVIVSISKNQYGVQVAGGEVLYFPRALIHQ